MIPIFRPTKWLVAAFILAMVSCRLYSVRPQPGQEIYSVLVNLIRAAWRSASERESKSERENWELDSWSLVAFLSISRAPTAMAAFNWKVSQSGASSVRVMVSSLIDVSASARNWVHSGIRSTNLRATGISHSGSSESDTRMVSPMPSVSNAPIPKALLIRPSSPSPASVTPRCSG